MKTIKVNRTGITLYPDRTRVLLRPFHAMSDQRAMTICTQVMALPEGEVHTLLEQLSAEFGARHLKMSEFFRQRFEEVQPYLPAGQQPSEERALLLGAYFSREYSLEAAASFNPSMVPYPDQSGLPPDSLRFVLSLRATGEGHISSITFRTGVLDANSHITIDAASRYSLEPALMPNATTERHVFERKLDELGLADGFSRQVLKALGKSFTLNELRASVSLALK